MPIYTPPAGGAADFELVAYTPPSGDGADFELAAGGPPTVVEHVIREDGTGDYTSLNAWQTAQVRDLVAANEIARAVIQGTWASPEASRLRAEGWTTSEACYVEIEAEGDARHNGVWSDTAYRLRAFDFGLLRFNVDHVHVYGLQVGLESPGGSTNGFRAIDTGGSGREGIIVDGCVVRFFGPYLDGTNGNDCQGIYIINDGAGLGQVVANRISNNVFYDFDTRAASTGVMGLNTLAGSDGVGTVVYNNTVYGCARGISGNARQHLANNVVYGSLVGADYPGSYDAAMCSHNASEDGTHPGADGVTLAADPFADAAGGDFSLAGTSALRDAGTDLAAQFTTDIAGTTRPLDAGWDIGAFETASGGGGGTTLEPALVSETSLAQAVSALKTRSAGLSAESDSALELAAFKSYVLGLPVETSLAQALTHSRLAIIGLAAEAGVSLDMSQSKTAPLGLSASSEEAFALSVQRAREIGLAQTAGVAQAIAHSRARELGMVAGPEAALAITTAAGTLLGLALESDAALATAHARAVLAGLAGETDSVLLATSAKRAAVGLASELDAALGIDVDRLFGVGLALETNESLVIAISGSTPIGLASESDGALSLASAKQRAIGLVSETGQALSINAVLGLVLGIAQETGSAQALDHARIVHPGLVAEIAAATEIARRRAYATGLAQSTEEALQAVLVSGISLGQVTETDAALAMAHSRLYVLGLAAEVDAALSVLGFSPEYRQTIVRQVAALRTLQMDSEVARVVTLTVDR